MNHLVIILAQGQQTRLREELGDMPKHLLRLPACDSVCIIQRTLEQVIRLKTATKIVVVGKHSLRMALASWSGSLGHDFNKDAITLPLPGNSSLKGLAAALGELSAEVAEAQRISVLLGDVVYSWACLDSILIAPPCEMGTTEPMPISFSGTSDLSRNAGELWGLSWFNSDSTGRLMLEAIDVACARHPKQALYQPGQMRRLYFTLPDVVGVMPDIIKNGKRIVAPGQTGEFHWAYVCVDDYTRDIDTPEHLKMLPSRSVLANADDKEHGLLW